MYSNRLEVARLLCEGLEGAFQINQTLKLPLFSHHPGLSALKSTTKPYSIFIPTFYKPFTLYTAY
jgi:hypothetical protein